ncbi:MAG: twin-arginine translocation signal domain-containing protein, partial [Proteobacteria bacterium]|nr:twin-arginine translocation signal domain-containing protein [Pseudomonadota bacterium]
MKRREFLKASGAAATGAMAGGAGILGTVDQAAASSISGSKKRTGKRSTADQFKRQKTQYDAHRLYV